MSRLSVRGNTRIRWRRWVRVAARPNYASKQEADDLEENRGKIPRQGIGRNRGWSIEFNASLLTGELSTRNQTASHAANTKTMGIACGRCVRATIQPVTVCVNRRTDK